MRFRGRAESAQRSGLGFEVPGRFACWLEGALEELVEGLHQRPVCPERHAQRLRWVFGDALDILDRLVEHAHLRLPEAVDALLGVADHEQPAGLVGRCQGVDDILLDPVGILELVNHQVVDLIQVRIQALITRRSLQQFPGQLFQVVEIQHRLLILQPVIAFVQPEPEMAPQLQVLCRRFVCRTGLHQTAGAFERLGSPAQDLQIVFEFLQRFFPPPVIRFPASEIYLQPIMRRARQITLLVG